MDGGAGRDLTAHWRALTTALLIGAGLAACGQKGPLYLPPPPKSAVPAQPEKTPAAQPAQPAPTGSGQTPGVAQPSSAQPSTAQPAVPTPAAPLPR